MAHFFPTIRNKEGPWFGEVEVGIGSRVGIYRTVLASQVERSHFNVVEPLFVRHVDNDIPVDVIHNGIAYLVFQNDIALYHLLDTDAPGIVLISAQDDRCGVRKVHARIRRNGNIVQRTEAYGRKLGIVVAEGRVGHQCGVVADGQFGNTQFRQVDRVVHIQFHRTCIFINGSLLASTAVGTALSFYLKVLDASVNDGVGNVVLDGTGG